MTRTKLHNSTSNTRPPCRTCLSLRRATRVANRALPWSPYRGWLKLAALCAFDCLISSRIDLPYARTSAIWGNRQLVVSRTPTILPGTLADFPVVVTRWYSSRGAFRTLHVSVGVRRSRSEKDRAEPLHQVRYKRRNSFPETSLHRLTSFVGPANNFFP